MVIARRCVIVAVIASIGASCTLSPAAKKNLRTALEIGKASTNALLKVFICKAVEKPYPISGGTFTVPTGGCRASDAPNGDLLLRVSGSGSRGGLVALDFSVDASARYTMRWTGDRVYLLPKDVTVGEPVVTAANGFARIAESFGLVRRQTNDQLQTRLQRPRTYIVSQGCTVDGWIGPNDMPTACETSNGYVKQLGPVVPFAQAPGGWEQGEVAGLNVGTTLAPARRPRRTWNVDMADRLRRWSEASARDTAVTVMRILHPTGKSAALKETNVVDDGDRVSVAMKVGWRGGFIGTSYETTVRWTLSQAGHVRALVDRDTATIPVKAANAGQLDRFFRDEVMPALPQSQPEPEQPAVTDRSVDREPVLAVAQPPEAPAPPPPPSPPSVLVVEAPPPPPPAKTAAFVAAPATAPPVTSNSTVPIEAQLAFERGESALGARELRVAELSYRDALASAPGWAPATNGLGNVFFKRGEVREAINAYRDAVAVDPTFKFGWFNLGYAAASSGDFATASSAYDRYTQLEPADPDGWYGLGEARRMGGRDALGAVLAYEKYVELEARPSQQGRLETVKAAIESLRRR